jgi:molecular chaperone GrpE
MDTKKKQEKKDENVHENCQKEVEEYKSKYLRALADYQNFERRARSEREEVVKESQGRVLLQLLPFLDHLEKAEIFVKDSGLKMIKDQFAQTLKNLGVEEMSLEGQEYDPMVAEAIEVIEGEKDGVIVEVVQKGYSYKGKVLRIAQVKVSKKKE